MEKEKTGNLFIKRPKLAIVISLAIMLAGMLMITALPLEEYPSITPPQVVVTATYAGASSDVVEDTIAAPVEAQLNGVEDMIYMSSTSQNGQYQLTLYFEIGSDPDMAVVNVQNQLQLVTPRLPEEVRRYGLSVKKSTGGPGLMMISVSSPTNTYDSLYIANYASIFIKDELARIKGVGKVQVFGSKDYSMRIWLDAAKMANLGVSVSEVNSAIQNQNTQVPAGDLGVEPMKNKQMIKLTMRTKGRLKDVSEFDTMDAYKADIKAKIEKRHENAAESVFEETVVNALNEKLGGEAIPAAMIDAEVENVVRDYDNRLRMQGLDLNSYLKYTNNSLEQFRNQVRPQAESYVKTRLALEKIAELENITVSDEELEAEYARVAEKYGMEVDKVKPLIPADSLITDLKVKKAMDLVKEKAVIKK